MVEEPFAIGEPDVVAPHSFDFQLRHYVIAPEVREGDTLVEIFRLASDRLVKVEVTARGSVEHPVLQLVVACVDPISASDLTEIRDRISWRLCLHEDLQPFYARVATDPVLSASVAYNYGAKDKSAFSLFDAVIDCICAQNTFFRRLYAMRANLAKAFGDQFEADGRRYHASPTAAQLAAAPLEAIRACGVGYRDRYIKQIAQAVVDGIQIESIGHLPRAEARAALMTLPGVGPYTADLALILGARRRDWMPLDLYIRETLRHFYFDGQPVPDAELRAFAERTWGAYQGYAGLYLTTNTELWAPETGRTFRLRSGARSD